MQTNKLYLGDNLGIMRKMLERSIDLIATDPPYNTDQNYKFRSTNKKERTKEFTDIWEWDDKAIETRTEIQELAITDLFYKKLNNALIGCDYMLEYATKSPNTKMRSYLTFIGPRLVEMYRLLKDTGSIYIHCEPASSHYLKILLDVIFSEGCFLNEIVWSYKNKRPSIKCTRYHRTHDVILFYSKTDNNIWNWPTEPRSETSSTLKKIKMMNRDIKVTKPLAQPTLSAETHMRNVWDNISGLNSQAKGRTGYPTEKPIALYERIIQASSNKGDLVLDPFCGSGTTLAAAKLLQRDYIGIDKNEKAIKIAKNRLEELLI